MAVKYAKSDTALSNYMQKDSKEGYDDIDGMQFSRMCPPVEPNSSADARKKAQSENFTDRIQFNRHEDTTINRRVGGAAEMQQMQSKAPVSSEDENRHSQHNTSGQKDEDTRSIPSFEFSDDENDPSRITTADTFDGSGNFIQNNEAHGERELMLSRQRQFDRQTVQETEYNETVENVDDGKSKDQSLCRIRTRCQTFCNRVPIKISRVTFIPVLALGLFIGDVVTDIKQAVKYKQDGENDLFVATIVFVVLPAVAMMAMDVSWVFIDRKKIKEATSQDGEPLIKAEDLKCTLLRVLLSFFTFGVGGRIFRTCRYWWLFVQVILTPKRPENKAKRDDMKKTAIDLQRDCHMIGFIEAFLEATPQLFVQLYIFIAFKKELDLLRAATLASSILSITWTYSAYYRSNREAFTYKADVSYPVLGLYCLATLCCLVPRFMSLALFAAYIPEYYLGFIVIGLVLFSHFIVMFLYILRKLKPELKGTVEWFGGKFMYYAFFAYVQLFLFMNLSNMPTRRRMKLLYGMIYFENVTMLIILIALERITIIHTLIVVPMVIHVVCLCCYYGFLHPKSKEIMHSVCKGITNSGRSQCV